MGKRVGCCDGKKKRLVSISSTHTHTSITEDNNTFSPCIFTLETSLHNPHPPLLPSFLPYTHPSPSFFPSYPSLTNLSSPNTLPSPWQYLRGLISQSTRSSLFPVTLKPSGCGQGARYTSGAEQYIEEKGRSLLDGLLWASLRRYHERLANTAGTWVLSWAPSENKA